MGMIHGAEGGINVILLSTIRTRLEWSSTIYLGYDKDLPLKDRSFSYGAEGGIRTPEGECQQIYSLPCLTASLPLRN